MTTSTGRKRTPCFLRRAVLLAVVCLLAACNSAPSTTELIVETCLDQDGNLLPPGVMVHVDGLSAIWNGEPLRFPIDVKSDLKLVTVKAAAGASYAFNSKTQYALPPGKTTRVTLRFFKPYDVTVEAYDTYRRKLPGVDVYANGQRIGATDDDGRFRWYIDQPLSPVGSIRPGTRVHIWLECSGQSTEVEPLIFQPNQHTYTIQVQLDALTAHARTGQCTSRNTASTARHGG